MATTLAGQLAELPVIDNLNRNSPEAPIAEPWEKPSYPTEIGYLESGWGYYPHVGGVSAAALYSARALPAGKGWAVTTEIRQNSSSVAGSPYWEVWMYLAKGSKTGLRVAAYQEGTEEANKQKYKIVLEKWVEGVKTGLGEVAGVTIKGTGTAVGGCIGIAYINGNAYAFTREEAAASFVQRIKAAATVPSGEYAGIGSQAATSVNFFPAVVNFKMGEVVLPVAEQLTGAAVTNSLLTASLPASFTKLPWSVSAAGSWSATAGWSPATYVLTANPSSLSGIYWNVEKVKGGNAMVGWKKTTGSLTGEDRRGGLWLFYQGGEKASGYQLQWVTINKTGIVKLQLRKWVEGVEIKLTEVAEVALGEGDWFYLVAYEGKISIWRRTLEGAAELVGSEIADTTFSEGYSGLDGNGSNPRITNFTTGKLSVASIEFIFTPTGSSASSASETDEFTMGETVVGTSGSSGEAEELFTREESPVGTSVSEGTDISESGEVIAMSLSGSSLSTSASRINQMKAPTGDEVNEWGKPSSTELTAIEGPGVVSGKKPFRMKRIGAGTGNVTAWAPNISVNPGTVVSVSAYRQASSEPSALLRVGIDWKKNGGTYISSSTSAVEVGGRAQITVTAPAEATEGTIVIDGLSVPNGGTFDFDAVLVELSGSVGSYFPTKSQLEKSEAFENPDGTWSFVVQVDQFEASEPTAGVSSSSGAPEESFEMIESASGSSSSTGSTEYSLAVVDSPTGSSVSSGLESDEATSSESLAGVSASSSTGTTDSTSAEELIAGESLSLGESSFIFERGTPDQPTPAPIQHLGRRRPVVWKFILINSGTMEELGEIKQARGKQLQLALDKPGGCNFSVPIDYPLFKDVEEINHGILAYRNKEPRYSGMIWNLDESIDGNSIAVQSVGWFETLNHRILRENVGYPPFNTGVVNAGQIVFMPASGTPGTTSYHPGGLLTVANAQHDTWLVEGSSTDVMQRIISYQKGQNIGQAITQLSEIEAGFDFWVDPLTRVLDLTAWNAVPDKTDSVVFGYNWGPKNIKQLGRQFDPSVMVNRVTALGKYGGGFAEDVESQNKYQLFEEMTQLNDVVDPNVLLGYAGGEVLLRRQPRVLYSFTPMPFSGKRRVPEPFKDYDIGDMVSFTAVRPPRVDIRGQAVRVYGMNIDISDEGNEKVSALQISP